MKLLSINERFNQGEKLKLSKLLYKFVLNNTSNQMLLNHTLQLISQVKNLKVPH